MYGTVPIQLGVQRRKKGRTVALRTTWRLFKLQEVDRLRASVQSTEMQTGGYEMGKRYNVSETNKAFIPH